METTSSQGREVEQRVDEPQQAGRVAVHGAKAIAAERFSGLGQRVLERAEHERERRSKFVTDVAEKRRLGGVELTQLRVGIAKLAVCGGELLAALDHLAFHGARLVAKLVP